MHSFRRVNHQVKLMDSKCRFSTKPDEQMAATSCLKVFGPEATTPTLAPLTSSKIPTKENFI